MLQMIIIAKVKFEVNKVVFLNREIGGIGRKVNIKGPVVPIVQYVKSV